MPGPALFAAFGLTHAGLALAYLSTPVAWPFAAVEAVTACDNLIVASGHRIGVGPHALPFNRLRFFLHAVVIGLLVPVFVGIGAAPPLASIVTVFLGLLFAFWIGWQAAFWWPFVVTLLMFSAAALPARACGPSLTSGFEIVFSVGLFGSVWYLGT